MEGGKEPGMLSKIRAGAGVVGAGKGARAGPLASQSLGCRAGLL